jgi:hypothetical protein
VKLTIFNAILILAIGMVVVLTGVILKLEHQKVAHPVIFAGLVVEFIGTLWFVLSLYRRRKSSEKL